MLPYRVPPRCGTLREHRIMCSYLRTLFFWFFGVPFCFWFLFFIKCLLSAVIRMLCDLFLCAVYQVRALA